MPNPILPTAQDKDLEVKVFLSQSTSKLSASPLSSRFKPYPEFNHFSLLLLLSCPFHIWMFRIAQFLLLTSKRPFSTQQTFWSFKNLNLIMTSLSSASNYFPCNSSSYNGLNTSTQSVSSPAHSYHDHFLISPLYHLTTGTNTGLLSIPWPYQVWCHLTFFIVTVPSNQNSLSPDTQVAPSSLCTMPSSQWQFQFSSVAQSCPCDPMDCSMPSFPVLHQLLELAQTHVHQVSDANQPSHPLSSPSPPAFNLSQYHGLFQWVSYSHQVAKLLELQHQSFQWIFRTDFLQEAPLTILQSPHLAPPTHLSSRMSCPSPC